MMSDLRVIKDALIAHVASREVLFQSKKALLDAAYSSVASAASHEEASSKALESVGGVKDAAVHQNLAEMLLGRHLAQDLMAVSIGSILYIHIGKLLCILRFVNCSFSSSCLYCLNCSFLMT